MRRVRYQVACSLDGYIAGPGDASDWIVMDPEIDVAALFSEFDTLLLGRRTYERLQADGGGWPGMEMVVFTRTLRPADHPGVRLVAEDAAGAIAEMRARPGKDIWLFGGGNLFRSLLELDCVDTVEPAVIPVLLGGGVPLLPAPMVRRSLELRSQRVFGKTGTVLLQYSVRPRAQG
jgi:dihydrofolate reductase